MKRAVAGRFASPAAPHATTRTQNVAQIVACVRQQGHRVSDQPENSLKNDDSEVEGGADREGSAKVGRCVMMTLVIIVVIVVALTVIRVGVTHN